MQKEFLISLEKLQEIKDLLPNIIYNELLKHTDAPEIKAEEPEVIVQTTEDVVEPTDTAPTRQDYIDAIEAIEATLDILSEEEQKDAQDIIDAYRLVIQDMPEDKSEVFEMGGKISSH